MADSYVALAPFSSEYDLVYNAEIYTYDSDKAVMDDEMFRALEKEFGAGFTAKVGNIHYQFVAEGSVPGASVAVPERNHNDPDTLLVQK